ncbi:MAG TPA: hypothetical protein VLB80_02170 [Candidatus Babeliales bacterium]|nr:hypothetical protein [Candidatus Babeliales bacterium]
MNKRSLFLVLSIMMINILIKAMDSFDTSQKCIVPSLKSIAEQHIIRNNRNNHPCDHIDQLLKNENIPYDFHDDLKEEFVKQYAGHGLSGGFNRKQLYDKDIRTAIVDDKGKHVFFVYSNYYDFNIIKLDTQSGQTIGHISGHFNIVKALINHNVNNSEILISGSADKTIKLWNLNNNKCMATFDHKEVVDLLSAEKNILCSISDKNINLWDISVGQCFKKCYNYYATIMSHSYLKDNILYIHSFNRENMNSCLLTLDIRSFKKILLNNINNFFCFCNDPNITTTIYVGLNNKNGIAEWDIRNPNKEVQRFYIDDEVTAITIQNNILYAASFDCSIKLYNIQNHRDIETLPIKSFIRNLQVHNSGLYATGSSGLTQFSTNSYDNIYNALRKMYK